MHLAGIVVSIVLLVTGYVFFFRSIGEQFEIQHEINLKLPPEEKFEPSFWRIGTWQKFWKLQREFLADSPRPKRLRSFQMIGCGLSAARGLLLLLSLRT